MSATETLSYLDSIGCANLDRFVARHRLALADAASDLVLLRPIAGDTLAWLTPDTAGRARASYEGGLELIDGRPLVGTSRAGDRLPLETTWRRAAPMPGMALVEWIVAST